MEERIGGWIETYTGRQFWPLDPRPEEIDRLDIAHALSQICRFTGHSKWHYSVATHSLLCAEYLHLEGASEAIQLRALLHDASEAYICDVARPVKPYLQNYTDIEKQLMNVIYLSFGLPADDPEADAAVKRADDALLHMEALKLMPKAEWATREGYSATIDKLIARRPMDFIEMMFLAKLEELCKPTRTF